MGNFVSNNSNPKILNLDDLELAESEIKIIHLGVEHAMRVLTVDSFIAQQKRAHAHEQLVAERTAADGADADMADVVELMRDAVSEFFPTLPIGELESPKLFSIFGWLNDLTAQMNAADAEFSAPADQSAEGNAVQEELSLT